VHPAAMAALAMSAGTLNAIVTLQEMAVHACKWCKRLAVVEKLRIIMKCGWKMMNKAKMV